MPPDDDDADGELAVAVIVGEFGPRVVVIVIVGRPLAPASAEKFIVAFYFQLFNVIKNLFFNFMKNII